MNEDKSLEMSKFINQNKTLEKNYLFQQKVIEVVI